jgi:hypothetical protein
VLQERVALRRTRASRPEKGAIYEEKRQEGRQEGPQKGQVNVGRFFSGARSLTPLFFCVRALQKHIWLVLFDSFFSAPSLTLTNNSLQMEIVCAMGQE